ncbi:MAG TPA: carboxypeptidase-like regulatory domain-containing protein, partial [Vicinamibacterales bacterium]|nr:carboxypeptidase-like regulatory domain-containing protein [Vicinamibacterales bacterium]
MHVRTNWLGLAFLLSILLIPTSAFAQGSIAGLVKDSTGAILPGVTVEAASPVLIEKVRTTISDSSGRYQIVDLRPGSYTITFTLPGFNTVKREGVTVAGSGNVAVDADLRVGALEETVTVTGEAPVVDTQSITQQRVLNSEMVDALPSARNYFGLARMIPGTLGGGNDVGGSLIQDVGQSVIVHGSKNVDQRVTVNGVSTMTLQAGGNIGGQTPDVGSASEVTVDTNSLSADLATGGVRINFVPKDGGNRFSNSTFVTFANESLQGDNFSDELRAAGLGTPNKLVNAFDLNQSLGGPFKQNKVWFWFSTRYNTTENEVPVFTNKYAYDPVNFWRYEPTTTPGANKGTQINSSIRVTWQASPRNKIAGTYKADKWCNC